VRLALARADRTGAERVPRDAAVRADGYFAVGMVNSAPLGVLSGQRCMMDFWWV
jgi:hypothetical protein